LALKFTALALFPYLCTSARRQASKFAEVISRAARQERKKRANCVLFNRSSTGGSHGSQSHESQQDAEEKAHEGIGQEAARAAGETGEEAEKRE
jgi:hypothetical protein